MSRNPSVRRSSNGEVVTITSITPPPNGTAIIASANHVQYTPAAGYSGPDSFTYTVVDGRGGGSIVLGDFYTGTDYVGYENTLVFTGFNRPPSRP